MKYAGICVATAMGLVLCCYLVGMAQPLPEAEVPARPHSMAPKVGPPRERFDERVEKKILEAYERGFRQGFAQGRKSHENEASSGDGRHRGPDFHGQGHEMRGFRSPDFRGPGREERGFHGLDFRGPGREERGFNGPDFRGPRFEGRRFHGPSKPMKPDFVSEKKTDDPAPPAESDSETKTEDDE